MKKLLCCILMALMFPVYAGTHKLAPSHSTLTDSRGSVRRVVSTSRRLHTTKRRTHSLGQSRHAQRHVCRWTNGYWMTSYQRIWVYGYWAGPRVYIQAHYEWVPYRIWIYGRWCH